MKSHADPSSTGPIGISLNVIRKTVIGGPARAIGEYRK